jgi:hypothetical protein
LEQRAHGPCLPVQRPMGQMRSFYLSIDQIRVDPLLWLLVCPPAKKLD